VPPTATSSTVTFSDAAPVERLNGELRRGERQHDQLHGYVYPERPGSAEHLHDRGGVSRRQQLQQLEQLANEQLQH